MTLFRHVKATCVGEQGPSRCGRFRNLFPDDMELHLAEYCRDMSNRFFGLSKSTLCELAYELAEKNNIQHSLSKTKRAAGRDWAEGFLRRHPELSLKKPEPTSIARAMAFDRVPVSRFFELLKATYQRHNFTSERILNVDESFISTVHNSSTKIISPTGRKQVGHLTSGERGKTVTIVCACSPSGIYVPPMFVFARKRSFPEMTEGAPMEVLVLCRIKDG